MDQPTRSPEMHFKTAIAKNVITNSSDLGVGGLGSKVWRLEMDGVGAI